MISHPKNRLNLLTQRQIRLDISVMDQAGGQDGKVLTKFFFCAFMGRDGVIVTEQAKRICYMR